MSDVKIGRPQITLSVSHPREPSPFFEKPLGCASGDMLVGELKWYLTKRGESDLFRCCILSLSNGSADAVGDAPSDSSTTVFTLCAARMMGMIDFTGHTDWVRQTKENQCNLCNQWLASWSCRTSPASQKPRSRGEYPPSPAPRLANLQGYSGSSRYWPTTTSTRP